MDNRSTRRAANRHSLRQGIEASFRAEGGHCNLVGERKINNRGWHIGIPIGIISQLSIGVCSKAPDGSIVLRDNAVSASTYGSSAGKIGYHYGRAAVRVGPIAQLTAGVLPPCHHSPIALNRQGVVLTCCNGNCVGDPGGLHSDKAVSCCPPAELAIGVIPPGPDRSIPSERNRMELPC